MGRGFIKNEYNVFLYKHGIQHQNIVPYTPQQNGVAERKNRTLVEMARCMFNSKGLHKLFWLDVICCDNYTLNKVPTKAILQVTPEEIWNERKHDISNLKVFYNEYWVHILNEK